MREMLGGGTLYGDVVLRRNGSSALPSAPRWGPCVGDQSRVRVVRCSSSSGAPNPGSPAPATLMRRFPFPSRPSRPGLRGRGRALLAKFGTSQTGSGANCSHQSLSRVSARAIGLDRSSSQVVGVNQEVQLLRGCGSTLHKPKNKRLRGIVNAIPHPGFIAKMGRLTEQTQFVGDF